MKVCYAPGYFAPLPEGHRFPMGKFPALYHILVSESLVKPEEVVVPEEASWQDLRLVHTKAYLSNLKAGTLNPQVERRLGLPWSQALVRRSRLATQGTLQAAQMALSSGISANLAGGMHHGFPDRGEGFCVLNDVAVAIRVLLRSNQVQRVLVVDLDVHQGNGTAAIFEHDPNVYTFSMHAQKNYPFKKTTSSRDVELTDGATDDDYLILLHKHLNAAIAEANPDLVFYLAGVDPIATDRLGRLALTRNGLWERDRYVLQTLRQKGLPIALVLSGGYAETDEATADLHAIAHRVAAEIF